MNFVCLFVLVYILKYKLFFLAMQLSIFFSYRLQTVLLWLPFQKKELVGSNAFLVSFGCFATKCSSHLLPRLCRRWWAQMDSDHRPHAYQACALTSWAMSPYVVEVIGFEPMTPCLQGRCSTSWAIPPFPKITLPVLSGSLLLLKTNKKETRVIPCIDWKLDKALQLPYLFSLKGGDPAAPSDTATLLRLHPSHRYCLRQLPPYG